MITQTAQRMDACVEAAAATTKCCLCASRYAQRCVQYKLIAFGFGETCKSGGEQPKFIGFVH
jgi:hypothetical protein